MSGAGDSGSEGMSDEAAEMNEIRHNSPSVWMEITGNETIPIVIDALLDAPPGKEFNKTELAEYAGTTHQSIQNHIDNLTRFQIVEPVPETQPTRYRLDTDSPVIKQLFKLNANLDKVATANERLEAEREDTPSDPAELSPTFPGRKQADTFDV